MDLDQAEKRRDLRLRKRLLQVLNAARARPEFGWARGRFIYDVVDGALPGGQRFESDEHVLGLLRDLAAGDYIQERDDRTRAWEPYGLDTISYRITNHGTALLLQAIDPDPLVEDDRVAVRRRESKESRIEDGGWRRRCEKASGPRLRRSSILDSPSSTLPRASIGA